MKKRLNESPVGMIVFVGALLGLVWLLSGYSTYEEIKYEKYNTAVHPGAVTYGTRSTAPDPVVLTAPRHRSVPMVSGGAVRSYAHHGHAAMSAPATAYKGLYTTSSAKVNSAGFGGGAGGAMTAAPASAHASSSGSTSVTMPVLAWTASARTAAASASFAGTAAGIGGMRRMPGITGDEWEGQEATDSEGTWVFDGETWILSEPAIGATKIEGGNTYRWNGSAWEVVTNQQDPGLPIGSTPYLLFLLLASLYLYRAKRRKHIANS